MRVLTLTLKVAGVTAAVNVSVERLLCGSQLAEPNGGCGSPSAGQEATIIDSSAE